MLTLTRDIPTEAFQWRVRYTYLSGARAGATGHATFHSPRLARRWARLIRRQAVKYEGVELMTGIVKVRRG